MRFKFGVMIEIIHTYIYTSITLFTVCLMHISIVIHRIFKYFAIADES